MTRNIGIQEILHTWKSYITELFRGNINTEKSNRISHRELKHLKIIRAIKAITSHKANGPDGVPVEVFKITNKYNIPFIVN